MNIKVGDTVIFRPKAKSPNIMPLGIRGTVLELGEAEDGKPAILLDPGFGEPFGVLVENLELEHE